MIVYVLTHTYYYESTDVIGVFSSEETAIEAMHKEINETTRDDFRDEGNKMIGPSSRWDVNAWEVD